ncbi:hypothetical protein HCN_0043 [Helicobacter cinaedi PAGU611]|uniref:Uncharacterized protein n=1 Tax=Helicobacter cinaedi CCUG 18818 = ATCC BAA-847 TaxID=537971 RepID=A0AAI8MKJ7_9HELI|nr:hypothetical protein [Helicobacter cinaedi]AWK60917.1 hypothetical protein C6B36_00100 [Helicobacter cinaedi]QOQ90514.1 hypothetical protein HW260_09875 [Helicobacter cinaedi]QOQ96686.1 hypothetical protein HW245_03245 [Helicobacter cinaedi]BAM11382.1 hypothetical protein HCN_0043 [Helicobacter cinaedi PAGU611]BAM31298.1 hypothetical protein HCBAA847_0038 [Helicobacter cinaedi CCUG 18818 = ATCC BAA-847]
MTLILENVKQEFLDDFKALADKTQAHLSIEQTKTDDFQQLREAMLQDLKKPENKAVFERLKDK